MLVFDDLTTGTFFCLIIYHFWSIICLFPWKWMLNMLSAFISNHNWKKTTLKFVCKDVKICKHVTKTRDTHNIRQDPQSAATLGLSSKILCIYIVFFNILPVITVRLLGQIYCMKLCLKALTWRKYSVLYIYPTKLPPIFPSPQNFWNT